MNLIRELLLRLEGLDQSQGDVCSYASSGPELLVEGFEPSDIDHHMDMLFEAELITSGLRDGVKGPLAGGEWYF